MIKSVFLGRATNIKNVYDEASRTRIRAICELPDTVITRENISSYKKEASEAVYAFSTWGMDAYTVEEIREYFPSLRALFYAAGTVKNFARPFLEAGVRIFSAWGANAIPVVEYTVSQIILANKGFFNACRLYSASGMNHPAAREASQVFRGNYGAKIGLLGLGMIGAEVARRLTRDYTFDVLAFDPFCSAEKAAALGVRLTTLEEIFSTCDVISNHLADKEEITGIISRPLLSSMKKTVTFINTGRGRQLDEEALADAMEARPLSAAVLDVTYPHEPVEDGSRLYSLPNIYLTPHIAGSAGDEVHRMALYMAEECEKVARNEATRWEVSLSMLATMA